MKIERLRRRCRIKRLVSILEEIRRHKRVHKRRAFRQFSAALDVKFAVRKVTQMDDSNERKLHTDENALQVARADLVVGAGKVINEADEHALEEGKEDDELDAPKLCVGAHPRCGVDLGLEPAEDRVHVEHGKDNGDDVRDVEPEVDRVGAIVIIAEVVRDIEDEGDEADEGHDDDELECEALGADIMLREGEKSEESGRKVRGKRGKVKESGAKVMKKR